jgi:HD-like signal output (HDOD) protein
MSVNAELRSLEIDIPAQPDSLVKLSLLLADEDINIQSVSSLVESDMALAAAVLKAVNSSLYGLRGRVQTVHQALTFLGTREIAAITFEMGLRAAFPPAAELEPLWERAARRGLTMGRLGQALSLDGWSAHSAGLFEECGKAVLFRHAKEHYRAMLRAAPDDTSLAELERAGFGVSHDALGAALCESWGLSASAAACVRHHVAAQRTREISAAGDKRAICALSVVTHALMHQPQELEAVVEAIAPQADLDAAQLLRAAGRIKDQLDEIDERAGAEAA